MSSNPLSVRLSVSGLLQISRCSLYEDSLLGLAVMHWLFKNNWLRQDLKIDNLVNFRKMGRDFAPKTIVG